MACKTPCDQCAKTGLPILFTRYAAAYSATAAGMATLDKLKPTARFKAQPGGVALQTAKYNVRMLRAGYLYIRLESAYRLPEWLAFAVHPHGYLTKFDICHPQDAQALAACAPGEWAANRSLVWIKDAEHTTKLHYMFHPDTVDPQHLKTVIGAQPDRYMQSFDVSDWVKGRKTGPDTATPVSDLGAFPVAEFKALHDEAVRNALEPQLHGLMGSSVPERAWGSYDEPREGRDFAETAGGAALGSASRAYSVPVVQGDYSAVHGRRLQGIAAYLNDKGGAIVACEDAIGIAQELGHLQAEAQMGYTQWQLAQADGAAKDVTNVWVYQTALDAQNLHELVKKGAIQKTVQRIKAWNSMLDRMDENNALLAQRNPEVATRNADTRAIAHANQQREIAAAQLAGDKEYDDYFDKVGAANILEAHRIAYDKNTTDRARLGIDQVAWLDAPSLKQASKRYSTEDDAIGKPGGGGALAAQMASCMAGCDVNSVGQAWLKNLELFGDNTLARVLSFNNKGVQEMLREMAQEAERQALPSAQDGEWTDKLTMTVLKPYAARFALADKAIAFAENPYLKPLCVSAAMRKSTWALHIASLMSVKMMQGISGLPVSKVEARILKYTGVTGLSTLGAQAHAVAEELSQAQRQRRASAAAKIAAAATSVHTTHAVPIVRAAAIGAFFDLGLALVKGTQLSIKPDQRTGVEMVGQVLQSIGSLADFRATAYEKTIYEGAKGIDLYKMKVYKEAADEVQRLTLRSMRIIAFKFLLPAALTGMFWDATDVFKSNQRGNLGLRNAQIASAVGTAFTISASFAAIASLSGGTTWMLSAAAWATIGCVLGLVGAVLTFVAVFAIWALDVPKWTEWLQDIPLNKQSKGRKPRFEDLKETKQRLANAMASLGVEGAPVGAPG